jgi:CheY-like chemotaxis protein
MVSQKKLLVVDDNPFIISMIRPIFEEAGFEVFAASSGLDCLDFLKREQFEGVILMDLMMPQMDGWETIEQIVQQGLNKNVVISVLSAKDVPDEKPETMKYIADYFTKPYDNKEIVKRVNSYFVYD